MSILKKIFEKRRKPDGFLIREVTTGDKELFRKGMQRLSPDSSFHRFHTHSITLNEHLLEYLTHVDQCNHVAIGVIDTLAPGRPGVAVARYIRVAQEPDVAEVAVTIIDEYQGRGLSAVLLAGLSRYAMENGITRFRLYIQAGRQKIRQKLLSLGGGVVLRHGTILEIEVPAVPDRSSLDASNWSRIFHGTLGRMKKRELPLYFRIEYLPARKYLPATSGTI
jgi:GNAT superfamily N-acetyltransferase